MPDILVGPGPRLRAHRGRKGRYLRLFLSGIDWTGQAPQALDRGRAVEAALDIDCACARNHIAYAVGKDGVSNNRRGAGAR
jgi:hypothetical protein